MLFKKAKKIEDLKRQLDDANRMAYFYEGRTCISWSVRCKTLQDDIEVRKGVLGDLGEKYNTLYNENTRLKKELRSMRNQFAHIELSANTLAQKAQSFKHGATERNNL